MTFSSFFERPLASLWVLAWMLACCGEPDALGTDENMTGTDASSSSVPGRLDAGASSSLPDATPATVDAAKPSGSTPGMAGAGGMAEAGTMDAAGALDAAATADASDANTTSPPTDAGGDASEAGSPGAGNACVVPKLPAATQLTAYAKHPDPFKLLDGSRITQKAQWPCRRAEIKAQLEEYESGPLPAVAREEVEATWSGNTLNIGVTRAGKKIQFAVSISRPSAAGTTAIPLLIAFKFMTLDETVFSQNGVATIIFDHDRLGAQSGGGSRGTGLFYDLYGKDHPASSMVAWAWGVGRIIDALEKTPQANVDVKRIGVTGCSRYGKGALLAGALDERVVLTIPQESGAGGSASWRVSQAQSSMGVNVQTLSNAANEQPWFRANFGSTFGGNNVTKLPFDHHMVMGLVAPRALLVIDNAVDWLGMDSSFTAGSIAHTIWDALGRGDAMGYWQSTGHTHCEFPAQQRAILDAYVKKFLVGGGSADTRILRADSAKADLAAWMDWTAPTLQ